MSIFPPEIIYDILVNLPSKELIPYTCVSKSWYALIHDKRFINAHHQRSVKTNSDLTMLLRLDIAGKPRSKFISLPISVADDNKETEFGTAMTIEQPLKSHCNNTHVVGYSHGLVCIHNVTHIKSCSQGLHCKINQKNRDGDIALWNPSIHKFKKIRKTQDLKEMRILGNVLYGFGYDSVNDDYKVVGVTECVNGEEVVVGSQVHIYSLKSNSWKRIENLPYFFSDLHSGDIVFLNGYLSWLMRNNNGVGDDNCTDVIVTLDLASEKYHQFPTPVDQLHGTSSMLQLKVVGGFLCICVSHYEFRHDVRIMKEYGVAESWTLLYSIEQEAVPGELDCYCEPLMFSKNGRVVLLTNDNDVFYWYDLEKKSFEKVFRAEPCHFKMPTICVGSLCLLDGVPIFIETRQQETSTSKKRKRRSKTFRIREESS